MECSLNPASLLGIANALVDLCRNLYLKCEQYIKLLKVILAQLLSRFYCNPKKVIQNVLRVIIKF